MVWNASVSAMLMGSSRFGVAVGSTRLEPLHARHAEEGVREGIQAGLPDGLAAPGARRDQRRDGGRRWARPRPPGRRRTSARSCARVVCVLDELIQLHGRPTQVRVDNGPGSPPRRSSSGAQAQRIAIGNIQPGKWTPSSSGSITAFGKIVSLRLPRLGAGPHRGLARDLQHRAAP
jgi:hypothetical protein